MWFLDLRPQHCLGMCGQHTFPAPLAHRFSHCWGPRVPAVAAAGDAGASSAGAPARARNQVRVLILQAEVQNFVLLLYKRYSAPLEKLGVGKRKLIKLPTVLSQQEVAMVRSGCFSSEFPVSFTLDELV